MKSKYIIIIIAILAFFTGCGNKKEIYSAQIETLNQIAQYVKDETEFEIPKGFEVIYQDPKVDNRIIVGGWMSQTFGVYARAAYDISEDKVRMIDIEFLNYDVTCMKYLSIALISIVILIFGILIISLFHET